MLIFRLLRWFVLKNILKVESDMLSLLNKNTKRIANEVDKKKEVS